MHDEVIFDRNSGLYDALKSLAKEAGVSVAYAHKAALYYLVDFAAEEFIANPRAERFRAQTEAEVDAAIMAAALSPEQSEERIQVFLDTYGPDLSKKKRKSLIVTMRAFNAHALEMKTAVAGMMLMTSNQTVH